MKVTIKDVYVKCDICGRKIDHHCWFNNVHQMKIKTVEKKGLKSWSKIDMCYDCYNKFSEQIRKELKEEDDKKNENI